MLQQQQQKTILPSSVYTHMYMALRSTGSEGVLREARGLPFTSAPELESLTGYGPKCVNVKVCSMGRFTNADHEVARSKPLRNIVKVLSFPLGIC